MAGNATDYSMQREKKIQKLIKLNSRYLDLAARILNILCMHSLEDSAFSRNLGVPILAR